MYKTKDEAIAALKNGMSFDEFEFDNFRGDKEVALVAVQMNWTALYCVSDELTDDEEIIIEGIRQDGWALKYASPRLASDLNFVLEAVKNEEHALEYASIEIKELCEDKDPIKALEAAIAHEKLQSQLPNKTDCPRKKIF